MMNLIRSERGTALVAALFFITALSLSATVIVWVTGSERRVSHNEYSHVRAFYASDSGAEEAINWLRFIPPPPGSDQPTPPVVTEIGANSEKYVNRKTDYTQLNPDHTDHKYKYDVMRKVDTNTNQEIIRFRPGWDKAWQDHYFVVEAMGTSASESESEIQVQASRLFRASQGGY